MNEQRLTRLLRSKVQAPGRRGWRCPDETLLAAYVDRGLPGEARSRVESHLAGCDACLEQVAFLVRPPSGEAPVAPGAVARARTLVASAPARWRPLVLRWGTAAAGVACVVLVAVLQFGQPGAPKAPKTLRAPISAPVEPAAAVRQNANPAGPVSAAPSAAPARPAVRPAVPTPPRVRTSPSGASVFAIVFPATNATLPRRGLEIRWQVVPGALYYEVDLVDAEGTVLWQSRVEGVSSRPPDDVRLEAGARYFVWVHAHLSSGGTIRSVAVPFSIGE